MRIDPEQIRFFNTFSRQAVRPMSPWQKLLALVAGAGMFVLALMFSVVLFAGVVTVGLALWGFLWWKTRTLRKQMRDNPPGGLVIEGEVIREGESVVDDDQRFDRDQR
ncbi:MAG: hypothetical protein KDE68_12145 [Rhodocyclaceae bacterium]|nr:hypothetical protein [Rhodocyclaceae bacterium]